MAGFIFEEGTQAQASAFTSGDTLIFKTDDPSSLNVTYAKAAGLSAASITVSDGTTALTFSATALEGGTTQFLSSGGHLEFASGTPVTVGDAATNVADAAYNFTASAATFNVVGSGDSVIHTGTAGDTVVGGAATGDLTIVGNTGNDIIHAGTGDNTIWGGAGDDTITTAGNGNSHIYGNAATSVQGATDGVDTITVLGGSNYINGNAGNDVIVAGVDSSTGNNHIQGGADDDSITIHGAGVNYANGNAGNDTIIATDATGNNTLRGGQGNDTIFAGHGNDVVMGDLGNDVIHAGTGIDVLTGGAGNDTFVFGTQAAGTGALKGYVTEVTDFTHGTDSINIGNTADIADGNVLHVPAGTTYSTEAAAMVGAQSAFAAGDVAVYQVGADTYLFYSHAGTATIDSVVKLDGVDASTLHGSTSATAHGDFAGIAVLP